MAQERGLFDFADVVGAISAKMLARHPHVFGDGAAIESAEKQTIAWEEHKRRERAARQATGLLDDVTRALPALLRAEKLQKRMASVGFDWDSPERVLDKIAEEAVRSSRRGRKAPAMPRSRARSATCSSSSPIWRGT